MVKMDGQRDEDGVVNARTAGLMDESSFVDA